MVKPLFCCSDYLVDSQGFVTDLQGNIVKTSRNPKGYVIVRLRINDEWKLFGVHALVARTFCNGYEPGKQVNHKDGIKDNNDYTNLEWVTAKENMQHSFEILGKDKVGINNPQAKAILGIDKDGNIKYRFDCIIDAGRYFSNGDIKKSRYIQNSIWRVLKQLPGRKSYRGCIWKYAEEYKLTS